MRIPPEILAAAGFAASSEVEVIPVKYTGRYEHCTPFAYYATIKPANRSIHWSRFPTCCGMALMGGFGLDRDITPIGLWFSASHGYPNVMATLSSHQSTIRNRLLNSGWSKIHGFYNRNSGNEVDVLVRPVPGLLTLVEEYKIQKYEQYLNA